jgi:ATP-dependent DNA helicase PIF1
MDVPVTYPVHDYATSQYPPALGYENVPPMPATEPHGGSKKRKHDNGHSTGNGKRLRSDEPSRSSGPQAALPSHVPLSSGLPQGTQHDPLEIESSPEPEAGEALRQPMNTAQSVLPQDPRHAGPLSGQSIAPSKEPVPPANDTTQHHTAPPANPQPARAPEPDFIPEPEPTLSAEQKHVVDLIVAGENVFYTGSAGCGKSTILKAFVKELKAQGKMVRVVAPTNLAALNVNGQTTWNFAGWTPDSMKKPLDKLMAAAHGKEVWERFDNTDVLVLDEISMVENLQFERLNEIMKASRGEKFGGGPFGGAQVVVTGDVSRPYISLYFKAQQGA